MPGRRHRRRRISRKLLIWIGSVLAALILVPVLVVVVLILTIDPNSYKQRIQEAVLQATGRELRIRGSIAVSASLTPTLTADDVTLANVPGGSRPDMARIDQMQVELSSRALFSGRLTVARLILLHPDLLLETDAAGRGNWNFQPQNTRRPLIAGNAAPAAPAGPPDARLRLQTVHIRDGRLTWRNGVTGSNTVFDVRRVSATAVSADAPVAFGAEIGLGRQRVVINGQTGPLSRLTDAEATTPWAMFLNLDNAGNKLTIAGSITRPLQLRGYSLRLDAAIPDLSTISWLSGVSLPPLRNVSATARVLDQNGPVPDVSAIGIQVGSSNLDVISPGFVLDTARIDAPQLSDPVTLVADGNFAGAPMHVEATLGGIAPLLPANLVAPPAATPGNTLPAATINVAATVAGGTYVAQGAMADPVAGTGLDIALGARVPDLAALSAFTGRSLPSLKGIAFGARLISGAGGWTRSLGLKGMVLTLPQGDLAGDLTAVLAPRLAVTGALSSTRIDVDTLLAAWLQSERQNALQAARSTPTPGDAIVPPTLPRRTDIVIPDMELPIAGLDRADVDLTMKLGLLLTDGLEIRDVAGHVITKDGRLAAGPLTAVVAGGQVSLILGADGRQSPPPVALTLEATGLDLKPLGPAFHMPLVSGTLVAQANLRAAGSSPHAMAGHLEGHASVTVTDAEIENSTLAGSLGNALRATQFADAVVPDGRTKLRCLALSADAAGGVLTIGTATLDTDRLLLNATGRIDLGQEALVLQLRPLLRGGAGGTGIVVPLRVVGSFTDARVTLDAAGAAQATLGANLGTVRSAVGDALGPRPAPRVQAAERGGDACGPAVAAARTVP